MKLSLGRESLWLYVGSFFLLISAVLYAYDLTWSDEDILQTVKADIQTSFESCLSYYSKRSPRSEVMEECLACELVYNVRDELTYWTENQYLPSEQEIGDFSKVKTDKILSFRNRIYYQIRNANPDSTRIVLIPISITYDVNNDFLIPYTFLGRRGEKLSNPEKKAIAVSIDPRNSEGLEIRDLEGSQVFTIQYLPVEAFRRPVRMAVLIFLGLAFLAFCIFLRLYTLSNWKHRYLVNGIFLVVVIGIRLLLALGDIPGDYLRTELFSPSILAFRYFIEIPSLGELTLNVFTFVAVVWVVYTHFFRLLNRLYRKILTYPLWVSVLVASVMIGVSCYLLKVYVDIFETILVNSQIGVEFSNIFKTRIYSYVILLDVGLLLLGIILIMYSLLKFNVLLAHKRKLGEYYWGFHVGLFLMFNLTLHSSAFWLALIATFCLLLLFFGVYRTPFEPILDFDLNNYLLIALSFSILITYNIIIGIDFNYQTRLEEVADLVSEQESLYTSIHFDNAVRRINYDMDDVRGKKDKNPNSNSFREWLQETYFEPEFTRYEVQMFMFDRYGRRMDRNRNRKTPINPQTDLEAEGAQVISRTEVDLYKFTNYKNEFPDLYVGKFDLELDSLRRYNFLLEIQPSPYQTTGLYPALSTEQSVYDDILLTNSFEYALYRDGTLQSKVGESEFPIFQNPNIDNRYSRDAGTYMEYIKRTNDERIVVVRYQKQRFADLLTSFSFIFYFITLSSIVLIILPVFAWRSLGSRRYIYYLPLRSKIRLGLLFISILPMLIIIGLLSPFVEQRYRKQAEIDLNNVTNRVTDAVIPNFVILASDNLTRVSQLKKVKDKVEELSAIANNDINIFDHKGRRIISSQSPLFEKGIGSDLMDTEAFQTLSGGSRSGLINTETIGTQSYLSGYRTIIGSKDTPIGYVNVPYLARQGQLDEQVLEFISYLVNIYAFVFLFINLLAVFLSSTITKPLRLVEQRLATIDFGQQNKPIDYASNDEIGNIVEAYNSLVNKLSDSESKFKQSQRELAWKQMARQVAHEIKNPLTPMKLSIQHLSRAWKEKNPNLNDLFPRVIKTLLSQIESMTLIANSFSEFAKMPEPRKTQVQVNEVLLEVIDLYNQSSDAAWLIDIPPRKYYTYADRDQLSRCFQNVIKNGLQAMEEKGILQVGIHGNGNGMCVVEIADNGKGMDEEAAQRAFEPSFSTKTSGMGLGLPMVKRMIENSGGKITFSTTEGVGTTFIIELPVIKGVSAASQ